MIPSATEVEEARQLLRKYLRPTRLVQAESLERRSEAKVYLKTESDLPTGSFKPRGALYALLTNTKRRSLTGVVAASTGNHGAAVAYAARLANLAATIFLPKNPNPVKRAASEILEEVAQPATIFVPMGDTALIRGVAAKRSGGTRKFASLACRRKFSSRKLRLSQKEGLP